MKLIIEDDEGQKRVVAFVDPEITIGRDESNTIPLDERNVSRHHARLTRQNGHVLVEDLGSYNGIFINGQRIRSAVPVHEGDLIQIGDFDLAILEEKGASAPGPGAAPPNLKITARLSPPPPPSIPTLVDVPAAYVRSDPPPPPSAPTVVDLATAATPPPSPQVSVQGLMLPPPAPMRDTAIIHMDDAGRPPLARPDRVETLDAAQAPRLVVLNTPHAGQEYACIRTELRIGRVDEESNDISLDHRSLSRSHAKLSRDPGGEWRIQDLQSANGLKVNGEKYAQATLASGDVVELGHVKLKFLLPGDAFEFLTDEERRRRRSRRLLGSSVLLLLVLVGGALGYLHAKGRLRPLLALVSAPRQATDEAEPADTDADTLNAVRASIKVHDFDGALAGLTNFHSTDEGLQAQAEALKKTAEEEAAAQKSLGLATQAVDAGRFAEARATLSTVKTELQASELAALQATLAARTGKPVTTAAVAPLPPSPSAPSVATAASATGQAEPLFQTGKEQLRKKDYAGALLSFDQCLRANPQFLHCEAYLGAAYIQLGQADKGAYYYRHFSEHAPTGDPAYKVELDQVRVRLNEYDQELKRKRAEPRHAPSRP